MTDFRYVTDHFAVSPQISVAEVAEAASAGFTLIVNNRPDGEAPGQPGSGQIEAAARAQGMAYMHAPVVGGPTADQVWAMRRAVDASTGKVLAFCRSGTRSIVTWALGQAGEMEREELMRLGAAAGYDLSALPHV